MLPHPESGRPARTPAGANEQPRPTLGTLLGRGLRARCVVCGIGPMFASWFRMNNRCSHCGLWFEREPGYFLGSIYVNYGITALVASLVYLAPMFVTGRFVNWLLVPVVAFCVVFPIVFFRPARGLWQAFDHYFSHFDPSERLPHEK